MKKVIILLLLTTIICGIPVNPKLKKPIQKIVILTSLDYDVDFLTEENCNEQALSEYLDSYNFDYQAFEQIIQDCVRGKQVPAQQDDRQQKLYQIQQCIQQFEYYESENQAAIQYSNCIFERIILNNGGYQGNSSTQQDIVGPEVIEQQTSPSYQPQTQPQGPLVINIDQSLKQECYAQASELTPDIDQFNLNRIINDCLAQISLPQDKNERQGAINKYKTCLQQFELEEEYDAANQYLNCIVDNTLIVYGYK